MKSILAPCRAPVKDEAQVYDKIPTRRGGYPSWPFEQRRVTLEAIRDRIVAEEGLSPKRAWKRAYGMLKAQWLASLNPVELAAYRADQATAAALTDRAARVAFWAQEGGAA